MNLQREVFFILSWILLLSGNICYCAEEEEEAEKPSRHENFPRLFRIFSRPGDRTSEKQQDSSFAGHLSNVFRGGSIGFEAEARPLAPFRGFIDRAKEFIPNPLIPDLSSSIDKAKELFPIPFLPGITSSPQDTDRKDSEVKPKPEGQLESDAVVIEPENPKVPEPEGPKFESMGEDDDEEESDDTPEPIENIIQPRFRQRRSPESKVFHVPLQFLSNAKPFEVQIK